MIKNRTVILALLTGLNLLNYIDRMIVAAVLRKIQRRSPRAASTLSNFQGGLLATAFLLGYFVTSPLFGARADKGSRKGLIALGVVDLEHRDRRVGLRDELRDADRGARVRRRRRGELRDARADDHRRHHAARAARAARSRSSTSRFPSARRSAT